MSDTACTTILTLAEAAHLLAGTEMSAEQAEVVLAHAIETGALHANIKRWATEQWDGKRVPGNLSRLETYIERSDLEAWMAARAAG